MSDASMIFNRRLQRLRRERMAPHFAAHDFLLRLSAARIEDRLQDVRRDFPLAVLLGYDAGLIQSEKIGHLIRSDENRAYLRDGVQCDPEWLPFAPQSLDCVLALWSLHRVNDLPGALIQIRRALKPGGIFIGMLPGAQTLIELRQALSMAQTQIMGGVSPQVAPFIDVRDGGDLLQRAGFALPAADSESLTVTYADALALMQDIRGMGEANSLLAQHKGILPRALFPLAAQHYAEVFPAPDDAARIRATIELVTLTGWSA